MPVPLLFLQRLGVACGNEQKLGSAVQVAIVPDRGVTGSGRGYLRKDYSDLGCVKAILDGGPGPLRNERSLRGPGMAREKPLSQVLSRPPATPDAPPAPP